MTIFVNNKYNLNLIVTDVMYKKNNHCSPHFYLEKQVYFKYLKTIDKGDKPNNKYYSKKF